MWEGSSVVMLSMYGLNSSCSFTQYAEHVINLLFLGLIHDAGSDEQKFLEASMAYAAGKPILSDVEFDNLKTKLKVCLLCFKKHGTHLIQDTYFWAT